MIKTTNFENIWNKKESKDRLIWFKVDADLLDFFLSSISLCVPSIMWHSWNHVTIGVLLNLGHHQIILDLKAFFFIFFIYFWVFGRNVYRLLSWKSSLNISLVGFCVCYLTGTRNMPGTISSGRITWSLQSFQVIFFFSIFPYLIQQWISIILTFAWDMLIYMCKEWH